MRFCKPAPPAYNAPNNDAYSARRSCCTSSGQVQRTMLLSCAASRSRWLNVHFEALIGYCLAGNQQEGVTSFFKCFVAANMMHMTCSKLMLAVFPS